MVMVKMLELKANALLILQNPDTSEDRYMHSAILQNLDFSMDAGTDGGRLRASGQFMTGYKPVIRQIQ